MGNRKLARIVAAALFGLVLSHGTVAAQSYGSAVSLVNLYTAEQLAQNTTWQPPIWTSC